MASNWSRNLVLAATASLAFAGPAGASDAPQKGEPVVSAASVASTSATTEDYPAINPDLLDPGIAANKAAQKRIID